ncbi:hypothetical protein CANARDRAFT_190540, partial [[Candida] arabinofermentans NRRL YB-2248]
LQIVSFCLAGNLAREALIKLTRYSNSYINSSLGLNGSCLWPNFTACFLIAFVNSHDRAWEGILESENLRNKKSIPLFVGISTGFCGSCSTFSSLILECFIKTADLLNGSSVRLPNHGYGVMEFFSVLFVQMGVSFFGYHLGTDLGNVANGLNYKFITRKSYAWFEFCVNVLGICTFIANLILSCTLANRNFWKQDWSFMLLFGPFGCFLRYWLSRFNSKSWFPIGTFAANIIGCALIAILSILLFGQDSSGNMLVTGKLNIDVLHGLITGFCGSLTTISTLVHELYWLKIVGQRYTYASASIMTGFLVVLLILGSYAWSSDLA